MTGQASLAWQVAKRPSPRIALPAQAQPHIFFKVSRFMVLARWARQGYFVLEAGDWRLEDWRLESLKNDKLQTSDVRVAFPHMDSLNSHHDWSLAKR